jgi:phage shock protein C
MYRRLYRSTRDRVFGGVCAGIAEYIKIDKGLLRFLAVIAIFSTGLLPGLIAYGISVLVIPTDEEMLKDPLYDSDNDSAKASNPERTRMIIGIALILIGVITLVKLLFGWIDFRYIFPVVLVVIGAYLIYRNRGQNE